MSKGLEIKPEVVSVPIEEPKVTEAPVATAVVSDPEAPV
jgi:hypothetical protein